MTKYDTIKTKTWQVSLPQDWRENGERDGSLYFESSDGRKGLYVSVWRLRKSDHKNDLDGTFANFWQTEMESFGEMEECNWAFSRPNTKTVGSVKTGTVSAYDRKRKYRIVAKLIAASPIIVRSSFHDYDCAKPDVSKRFFARMIQSLRLLS